MLIILKCQNCYKCLKTLCAKGTTNSTFGTGRNNEVYNMVHEYC